MRFSRLLAGITSVALAAFGLTFTTVPSQASATDSLLPAAAFEPIGEPVNLPAVESEINVTGAPFTGTNPDGTVAGYADLHTHIFSNLAFGGNLVCGKPFDQGGIAAALTDCPVHYSGNGTWALFEQATNAYGAKHHDPVGWPSFKYWPSYGTLTHQAMYYRWIERSWRGGQRVLVNQLVQNEFLCSIDAAHDGSCQDNETARRQAAATYDLQAYIDAQYGGPGKGWFRVVTTPNDARKVIEAGKLAVILAQESSAPFGCKLVAGIPQCTEADIDRGLDELKALGAASVFLCHKYDNALCGVRFDPAGAGAAVQTGQFLTSGTLWETEPCAGPAYDNNIGSSTTPACNKRGLTDLGEYALRGLMKRGMMLEIDHMSVKAAQRALSIFENYGYAGVISGHSWMDVNLDARLFKLGGFLGIYPFDPKSFAAAAAASESARDAAGTIGIGIGVDANGIGNRFAPTKASDGQPVVNYPVKAPVGDSMLDRQVTGERTWDYNLDAIAHYGMLPDWLASVEQISSDRFKKDLSLGAEGYLRTWTKAASFQDNSTNFALNQPTKISSVMANHASNSGDKAVDGDSTTRWESAWANSQWLTVDLGAPQSVRRVEIDWEAAYAKSYKLIGSDDGVNWRTLRIIEPSNGGRDLHLFDDLKIRYVGLGLDTRATAYGFSIWEFRVLG